MHSDGQPHQTEERMDNSPSPDIVTVPFVSIVESLRSKVDVGFLLLVRLAFFTNR